MVLASFISFLIILVRNKDCTGSEEGIITIVLMAVSLFTYLGLLLPRIMKKRIGLGIHRKLAKPVQHKSSVMECAICIDDIKLLESVIHLNCKGKHVFHEGCITEWTKVKYSCPICREKL